MPDPVMPFDRKLYRLRRVRALARAQPCDFLLRLAMDDLLDRLADVTRRFNSALLIGQTPGMPSSVAARVTTMDMAAADVIADEEFLPFADGSFDLVIAPLTLHWVNDLPGTLLQIKRTLRPDGFFIATMLGCETLWELRQVLLQAESETSPGVGPRVSPFADLRDMGGLMQRADFALPVVDGTKVTAMYNDLFALVRDLRAMGATNAPERSGGGFFRGRRCSVRPNSMRRASARVGVFPRPSTSSIWQAGHRIPASKNRFAPAAPRPGWQRRWAPPKFP